MHPAIRQGRTAVVTGAASGIGLASARALAAQGMTVALVDLPGAALDSAAAGIAGARAFAADVADPAALTGVAAQVARDMQPVTVLMNNAGIGLPSSTLSGPEAWVRTLATNLWGVIHGTMAFAPAMIAHGETAIIVNTGSKQGITTPPGNPAYNVSKSGLKSYTEALAHELRNLPDSRISAHLLIPGWVHTGITATAGAPKPDGAWTAEQLVAFMMQALDRGDFYILCPDNDVSRELDEKRIAWAAADIMQNRPALSRWHPDWVDVFRDWLART